MSRESVYADEFTHVPHDSRQSHATSAMKELFRRRYATMCLEASDVRSDARKRSIKKIRRSFSFLEKCCKREKVMYAVALFVENYKTLSCLSFFPDALHCARETLASNSANYSEFGVSKRRQVVYLFPRTSANFCQNFARENLAYCSIYLTWYSVSKMELEIFGRRARPLY